MDRIRDKFLKYRRNFPRLAYYGLSPELIGFIYRIGDVLNDLPPYSRDLNAGAQRIVSMVRDVLEEYLEEIDFPMGVKYHDTDAERADHKSTIVFQTRVLANRLAALYDPFLNAIGAAADMDRFSVAIQHILMLGTIFADKNPYLSPSALAADAYHNHISSWNKSKKTGVDIDKDLDALKDEHFDELMTYVEPVNDDWEIPSEEDLDPPPPKKPRGSGKIKRRSSRRRKTNK